MSKDRKELTEVFDNLFYFLDRLFICDDADFVFTWGIDMKTTDQIIVTTRKLGWVRRFIHRPESCYCIIDGKICEIEELLNKNINSMNQLCNILGKML